MPLIRFVKRASECAQPGVSRSVLLISDARHAAKPTFKRKRLTIHHGRRRHEKVDASGAGTEAHERDSVRVAAELADVLLHPVERCIFKTKKKNNNKKNEKPSVKRRVHSSSATLSPATWSMSPKLASRGLPLGQRPTLRKPVKIRKHANALALNNTPFL